MHERDRPAKVVFVVVTDGQDNASSLSSAVLRTAVKHQEEVYSWQFTYLGSNQDAEQEGAKYGINLDSSLTFGDNKIDMAFSTFSDSLKGYRTGATRSVSYTSAQKKDAK